MNLSLAQGAYILIGMYMKAKSSASLYAIVIIIINFLMTVCTYIYHYTAIGILSVVYKENMGDLHIQGNLNYI